MPLESLQRPFFRRISPLQELAGSIFLVLSANLALAAPPSNDPDAAIAESSGNLLQWGIPLIGLGLTFLLNPDDAGSDNSWADRQDFNAPGLNWPGPTLDGSLRRDFLISFARMEVSTYALKYGINEKRPNGGGQSFPSGHTASAFMGAEFIRKHYGLWWGIPAYGAATFVGYSRVEAKEHHLQDVIGGALIGIASNYDFGQIKTHAGALTLGPTFIKSYTPKSLTCSLSEAAFCVNNSTSYSLGIGFTLRF